MKGYAGKILHVDLTAGSFRVEQPAEEFYRKYIGGSCLGTYYLLKEMPPRTDALSPESVLVFSTGPIAGSKISGAARHCVTGKSPQTGGIMASEAGGYWAPEFRKAGFDAVVLKGRAEKPSYLWLHDGAFELRNADGIWGLTTKEAQRLIRSELHDEHVRVAQIGPAGENLCLYANIVNELAHFNGRGGLGAVMGSKNLRAIAVRGTEAPDFFDAAGMKEIAGRGGIRIKESEGYQGFKQDGTHGCVVENIGLGGLPTNNWQSGTFAESEKLTPDAWNEELIKPGTCYACAQSCKRHVDSSKTDKIDPVYGGPEYETVGMCGSNLGISDKLAICRINETAARYAFDTISFGATLSFVFECFEKGVIGLKETEGIDCSFGNIDSALKIAELTGKGAGFGRQIARGSAVLAEEWGRGTEQFLLTVKGKEFPAHMPQTKAALALTYALVPFGSDHCSIEMDPSIANKPFAEDLQVLGLDSEEDPYELNFEKSKLFWRSQMGYSLMDTASVCLLAFGFGMCYSLGELIEAINYSTGWKTNYYEMLLAAERRLQMMRVFNIREGFTNEDDELPAKLFKPLHGGITDGTAVDREAFIKTREYYYELAGWKGEDGAPTDARLRSLGLDWLQKKLSSVA